MKKLMALWVIFTFAAVGWAATPGESNFPDEIAWMLNQEQKDTATVEKSLDEIVEEEGWKLKKPFTGSDWDWNFNWDEDNTKDKKSGRKTGYFRGGAGGFEYSYLTMDLAELNNALASTGVDRFPNHIFMTGGGGWGFIGHGIRIGGVGAGGSREVTGLVNGLQREIKLSASYGGFMIEKVFHPFNRSELSLGVVAGGGAAELEIKQWHGPVSWNDIISGYEIGADTVQHNFYDYTNVLKTDFFTLVPSIGVRYNILRWFAVGANVGYFYTLTENSAWKMDGKRVTGFPKIDFSNVIYKISFYFGG